MSDSAPSPPGPSTGRPPDETDHRADSHVDALAEAFAGLLDTLHERARWLRFDGTRETEFDPAKRPVAELVKLDDLDHRLGPGVPRISPEQRRAAIAARRRHVQARFNT